MTKSDQICHHITNFTPPYRHPPADVSCRPLSSPAAWGLSWVIDCFLPWRLPSPPHPVRNLDRLLDSKLRPPCPVLLPVPRRQCLVWIARTEICFRVRLLDLLSFPRTDRFQHAADISRYNHAHLLPLRPSDCWIDRFFAVSRTARFPYGATYWRCSSQFDREHPGATCFHLHPDRSASCTDDAIRVHLRRPVSQCDQLPNVAREWTLRAIRWTFWLRIVHPLSFASSLKRSRFFGVAKRFLSYMMGEHLQTRPIRSPIPCSLWWNPNDKGQPRMLIPRSTNPYSAEVKPKPVSSYNKKELTSAPLHPHHFFAPTAALRYLLQYFDLSLAPLRCFCFGRRSICPRCLFVWFGRVAFLYKCKPRGSDSSFCPTTRKASFISDTSKNEDTRG